MQRILVIVPIVCLFACSGPPVDDAPSERSSPASEAAMTEDDQLGLPQHVDLLALAGIDEPRGVRIDVGTASPGYVLFTPMLSDATYLIDRKGRVVHTWRSDYAPGSEYLLEDGHLMRGARVPDAPRFNGGGQSGRIEKFTFDGELVWAYELANEHYLLHHDFEVMPNGNILAIAWEAKTPAEAAAAGREAEKIPQAGLWPDMVIEIEPTAEGGNIVWEWHAWDHMVQDHDPALPNHGQLQDHPRRIDINAGPALPEISEEELAHLKATNQAPSNASVGDRGSDMHHSNAISYNAELDQIALSVRAQSEIWIIDHGITSEEARGPAGDLLYRWGNPSSYGYDASLQTLVHQHDVRWIPQGFPGAGNLMAFSNEVRDAQPPRSRVVEFTPPLGTDGRYQIGPDQPFGPVNASWSYSDGLFSPFISGAHRLADGNTLIMFGPQGRVVEATSGGEIVWEYWTPYSGEVRMPDGSHPQPGAPFMYAAFRATFIPSDHPALAGRDLAPLHPQPAPSVLRDPELAPFRKPPET